MTFDQFSKLITEIANIPHERIREDASFRDDLGMDSLQMVNLLVQCMEATGAEMDLLQGSEDLSTPGHLFRALKRGGA